MFLSVSVVSRWSVWGKIRHVEQIIVFNFDSMLRERGKYQYELRNLIGFRVESRELCENRRS